MLGGVTNGSGSNISNGGSAPDIVIGANSSAVYEVDRSQSVDFAEQTGTAVDADSGLGYVTVTPLPAGTLFTETQSGLDVTWSTYSVTVTIGGTNFPVNFNAGDTRAVVIEKVPVGASLSATATIGVSSTNPGAALGYSSLTASTLSPVTIQSGSNAITMWVQYPLECHISTAYQADASITGTPPAYYTNAGPATLAEVTASYTDSSTGSNMRFTGWSLTDGGPVVIAGHSIPAGQYKGKLSLWANYDIGSLPAFSIDIAPPASAAPVPDASSPWALDNLTDSFTLTPSTSAGSFPSGTTFHWEIEASGGSRITRTTAAGESCSVSPASLGLNESSMGTLTSPAAVTVRCTARNDLMDADEDAPAVTQNMFLGCTIPAFTVQISPPSSYKSAKSDESDPANPKYALVNKTDLFTLTPVPTASGAAFPAGTTFSWSVMVFAGSSMCTYSPAETTVGTNAVASFSDTGAPEADIGHNPAAANPILVSCTASNPRALTTVDSSGNAAAFVLYTVPEFKIEVTPPAGIDSEPYGSGADATTTYLVSASAVSDSSKTFTLEAKPVNSSDTFPPGTRFAWKFSGADFTTPPDTEEDRTRSETTYAICNGEPSASGAAYVIECKAVLDPAILPDNATIEMRIKKVMSPADLGSFLTNPAAYATALGVTGTGSSANPYKLPAMTGIDSTGLATINSSLQSHPGVYVDLSETQLPDGLDMTNAFSGCSTLVKAPVLPASVTDLNGCFNGCSKLREAPVLPEGVLNISGCFYNCSSLVTAPVIPESVVNMPYCFYNCGGLDGNVVIKSPHLITNDSVIDAFYGVDGTGLELWVYNSTVKDKLRANAFSPGDAPLSGDFHYGLP